MDATLEPWLDALLVKQSIKMQSGRSEKKCQEGSRQKGCELHTHICQQKSLSFQSRNTLHQFEEYASRRGQSCTESLYFQN